MVDVPTAAAYLQENENDGLPIFVWLFDTAANIRRTLEGSRRKVYQDAVFKGLVDELNPDYRSEPSCLHQIHYSGFNHH